MYYEELFLVSGKAKATLYSIYSEGRVMENYIVSYDICSLLILITFLGFYLSSRKFTSRINRIFNLAIISVTLMVFFDLLGVVTLVYRFDIPLWINYFVQESYQVFQMLAVLLFSYYVVLLTVSESGPEHRRINHVLFFIPGLFVIAAIYSSGFTGAVLYFDEELNYCHGPLMIAFFVIAMAYFFFDVMRVLLYGSALSFMRKISIIMFLALVVAGVVIQKLFPNLLTTGFGATLGTVYVYLTHQNPADMIDPRTELYNRRALVSKFSWLVSEEKSFCAVAIGINDKKFYSDSENYKDIDEMYIGIAGFLRKLVGSEYSFSVDHNIFAMILDGEDMDPMEYIEMVKDYVNGRWGRKENLKPIVNFGVTRVPEDAIKPRHIVDQLEMELDYAAEKGEGVVVFAKECDDLKDKKITRLENRQRALVELSKKAQADKKAAQRAEQSKSMFLAQMSHEIRTPMTAILGMTEIIERDTKEPATRSCAQSLQNSGRALLTIINDILDYSKIEAGKFDIVETEYNFAGSIENAISMIKVKAAEKNLELFADIDPTIPEVLYGDEVRNRQIIMNILSNAVKYTKFGSVTVSAGWERIDEENAMIRIAVSDTGIGIKEENFERLFDEFDRFDQERNKGIAGTGLGLAIVNQLVKLMNGEIKVESEYGKGSCFTVSIPQKIVDASPSVSISSPESYRLVAFTDSEDERKRLADSAKSLGVEIDFAESYGEMKGCAENPSFTHLLMSSEKFENILPAVSSLLDDERLVIVASEGYFDRSGRIRKVLAKPIYAYALYLLLEGADSNHTATKLSFTPFIAPDARLLIVDDNGVNLEICDGLLKKHRLQIDYADSGDRCLQLTEENEYDLIFLDHMMPGKDGIITLKLMRESETNKNAMTPVIAFTANAVSGMKEMFIENGFEDFLSKPIDIVRMDELIASYIPAAKIHFLDSYETSEDEEENEQSEADTSLMIRGMDVEKALANCGGSRAVLENLLDIIATEGVNKISHIRKLVKNQDLKNYTIEIHSLKTTAANIGMTAMSERAKRLEMFGRDGNMDIVLAENEAVMEDYERLLADIEVFRKNRGNEGSETEAGTGTGLDAHDELVVILSLIHDFETDIAEKLVKALPSELKNGPLSDHVERLNERMSLFDYDGAASVVEELIAKLEE